MDERLPLRPNAGFVEPLTQLTACERAVAGQRALHDRHAAVGLARRDAFLAEPAGVGAEERRGGQGVEPRIVLTANEVQRAPVQPSNHERALGERPVDVRCSQTTRPRADREAGAARVLGLHREQPLGHGLRRAGRRAGKELRAQTRRDQFR